MKKRVCNAIMLVIMVVMFGCSNACAGTNMDLRALEASLENGFSTPKDLQTMLHNAWLNGYNHCRVSPSQDGDSFVIEVAVRGLAAALRTLSRSESEQDALMLMQARDTFLTQCQSLCKMLVEEGWDDLHFSFVLMNDNEVWQNEYASHAVIASITVTNSQPVFMESKLEAWNMSISATPTISATATQTSGENAIIKREPTYILNINSKKFHHPTCDSVGKTKEQNRKEFFGERDELISTGYTPCGSCRP